MPESLSWAVKEINSSGVDECSLTKMLGVWGSKTGILSLMSATIISRDCVINFPNPSLKKIQEREIIKGIVCPRQFLFDKDKLCLLGFCGSKQFILITENVYFKKFKFSWCPFSLVEILTDRNLIGRDKHLFTWRHKCFSVVVVECLVFFEL